MRRFEAARALGGGLAGVALLVAIWQALYSVWGPFVLPAPLATMAALAKLAASGAMIRAAWETAQSAVGGFVAGVALGVALGLIGGASGLLERMLSPAVTIVLGVPPIAWVVLALLWFGSDGASGPAMTVALTTFPLVFGATAQGAHTADPALTAMARAFGANWWTSFVDVRLPQLLSHLFPALATAHGVAWKAAVMAEVMGSGRGIGGALATARANLDLAAAMAWITVAVTLLLSLDALVLSPLRRRGERWREAR